MPRTFSLATLLLAITLFCLLFGLGVNFPATFLFVAFMFSPAFVLMITLCAFSKHPLVLMFNAVVGGIFGFAAYPLFGTLVSRSGFSLTGYLSFTAPTSIGVLVAAGAFLLAEIWDRQSQPQ